MKTLLGCLMVSKTVRSWSEFCRAGWRCVGQGWQSSKECGHGIRPSVVKMCVISGGSLASLLVLHRSTSQAAVSRTPQVSVAD